MVDIVPDSIHVHTISIEPSITFQIEDELDQYSFPIRVDGWVLSADEKYLANLIELPNTELDSINEDRPEEYNFFSKAAQSDNQEAKKNHTRKLMFTLNKKSLDYIENQRYKTKNRNVVFNFILNITHLKTVVHIGSFSVNQHNAIEYNDNPTTASNPKILVSGDYNQMLQYQVKRIRKSCTIKSSDWINDFQEPMGIGRFFIVEVPTPKLNSIDLAALSGEQKNFIDRLNKAYETIEEMEQDLRNGEWGNVVMKLRNVELFKVNFTNFIKKMISETTSIEEVKAGELTLAIEKLREYASDLHHVVNSQGKVKEVYTGGKADAYLAYMLVASITNVLSKKFLKITQPSK